MQNTTINKIIVTGPNYQKFLDDNIVDGKLDFSKLVAIPDNIDVVEEDLTFKLIDNGELFLNFTMHDYGFHFQPSHGFWKINNKLSYDSFHNWAINNWGSCKNNLDVELDFIENGVVIRFISYFSSPISWSLKLKENYDYLEFDCYSLSCRGKLSRQYSESGLMRIYVSDYLRATDFSLLDCTLVNVV